MENVKKNVEKVKIEILPNDDSDQCDLKFKLIVVGDSGVGKSCLTYRCIKKLMPANSNPTVGFDCYNFVVKIDNDVVKLQIWDTSGQENYKSMVGMFYKQASCALLVYSIDNKKSFKHLNGWLNEIKINSSPDIKTILIGNKTDLGDQRKVTISEGEQFQKEKGIDLFIESSAMTGDRVEKVFIEAAKLLYTNYLYYKSNQKDNAINQIEDQPNALQRLYQSNKDEIRIKENKGCC